MRIEQLWPELDGARRRELARASGGGASGWVLRRVQPIAGCRLLAGLELASGRRGLLLELPASAVPAKRRWPRCRGLDWLTSPAQRAVLFGVRLKEARHADLFDALADDLARRVGAAEAGCATQLAALLGGVARWQRFLAVGAEGLSDEAQRGLWGELHFLRGALLAAFGAEAAVAAWQGHAAAHQDFLVPRGAVEVKTTSGKAPHIVRITSERQLDDRGLPALYLRHLALAVRDGAGETLPSLVAALREQLLTDAIAAERFEDALLAAGYLDAHAWRYEGRGYAVRETNDFAVRGRFPRLTERDLPAGVGDVRYALSLDACRAFLLAPDALLAALSAPFPKRRSRQRSP